MPGALTRCLLLLRYGFMSCTDIVMKFRYLILLTSPCLKHRLLKLVDLANKICRQRLLSPILVNKYIVPQIHSKSREKEFRIHTKQEQKENVKTLAQHSFSCNILIQNNHSPKSFTDSWRYVLLWHVLTCITETVKWHWMGKIKLIWLN